VTWSGGNIAGFRDSPTIITTPQDTMIVDKKYVGPSFLMMTVIGGWKIT
jgi:hypothetical protein